MIFESILEILSGLFIILGSLLVLIGAIGFFRFPEFWSRLHAASVIDSGGMILIVAGMCLYSGLTLVTVKLIFIAIFLIITGPTATHAIANAALISGLRFKEKKVGIKAKEISNEEGVTDK
tara:strand:- start:233 stop:595 length:363 start_codon:yes stop_codon:yes gene_type:complete